MIFVGDSWWYVGCRDRIVETCFDETERVFEFLDVEGRVRLWFRIGRRGFLMNLIQTGLASAGRFSWCVLDNMEAWFRFAGWMDQESSEHYGFVQL